MDELSALGHHTAKHTSTERTVPGDLNSAFERSPIPLAQKLQNFPRHVRRQDLARHMAKVEIFKQVLDVNGSVVECGVFAGGGLMTWYQTSAILEPFNHTRRIIGFDTFSGFPSIHAADTNLGTSEHLRVGAFKASGSMREELESLVAIHDRNRPLGHIKKIELVEGDAMHTIPEYVNKNKHLLVSLLYLDFDLYEPTKVALASLYPRVVAGGIIAFDELNCAEFPGETQALLEQLDTAKVKLRRFAYEPYISYFVKA